MSERVTKRTLSNPYYTPPSSLVTSRLFRHHLWSNRRYTLPLRTNISNNSPLFDRVFTAITYLGCTSKILATMAKRAWLSLIWAIKPENTRASFAILDFVGVCLITMLPVGLVKLREIQMGVPRCEMCTMIFFSS